MIIAIGYLILCFLTQVKFYGGALVVAFVLDLLFN